MRAAAPTLAEAAAHAGIATHAAPARPALLLTSRDKPLEFEHLDQLARKVQALRAGRGLRLADCQTTAPGFATFPAVNLYVTDDAGQETWLGRAAIQGRPREVLEAAIRAAEEAGR